MFWCAAYIVIPKWLNVITRIKILSLKRIKAKKETLSKMAKIEINKMNKKRNER